MTCLWPNCRARRGRNTWLCAEHIESTARHLRPAIHSALEPDATETILRLWKATCDSEVTRLRASRDDLPNASLVLREGQWSGEPCVVIGGGESLRGWGGHTGDPILSWNFGLLRNVHTIGVNVGVVAVPDIAYVCDHELVKVFEKSPVLFYWHERYKNGPVRLVNHHASTWWRMGKIKCDGCYWLRTRHGAWPGSLTNGLASQKNSGLVAIELAELLGADPIYLVGFDCSTKVVDGQRVLAHWHDVYRGTRLAQAGAADRMREEFARVVPAKTRRRLVVAPEGTPIGKLCGTEVSLDELARRVK